MRNALSYVSKGQPTVVAAAIQQAFNQPDRDDSGKTWRHVADQRRSRTPKLADLMDVSEPDMQIDVMAQIDNVAVDPILELQPATA